MFDATGHALPSLSLSLCFFCLPQWGSVVAVAAAAGWSLESKLIPSFLGGLLASLFVSLSLTTVSFQDWEARDGCMFRLACLVLGGAHLLPSFNNLLFGLR